MTTVLLQKVSTRAHPGRIERRAAPKNVDTVRALCHDLRQPLAAILLLAGAESGDLRRRFDGILDQAQWLADMVEGVIGGAAGDLPKRVDVADLASGCVQRAKHTADCEIGFISDGRSMAVAAPVALSRALSCVLDNAVRGAGPGGQVTLQVTRTVYEIIVRVVDDAPRLGHVPIQNSLGLTITRALVSACGGEFELKPGAAGGMVAQIVLPALRSRALAS
jgi:K+-sensing histidine kinase KdpD